MRDLGQIFAKKAANDLITLFEAQRSDKKRQNHGKKIRNDAKNGLLLRYVLRDSTLSILKISSLTFCPRICWPKPSNVLVGIPTYCSKINI